MAALSDYVTGTITLTNGSADFTGAATGWLLAGFKEGDTIIDVTGATEYMGVVASIDANGAGTLTKPWEGPSLTNAAYRMRYQPDGARVSAQARNLIELLGNGNLQAVAGLEGSANQIPMFTGPGAMTLVPKTDLVSGAAYDVQVADLAARAAYDGQAQGFSVLVANTGDGRAAIYAKNTNAAADWSNPAYVTGPAITLDVTEVDEVPYGTPPDVTLAPRAGGYDLAFDIPRGMIIEPGTTTTLAPDQPAAVTFVPITGGYRLDIALPRGPTGDINGVTPFWVSRLGSDVDAAAARAGLGAQASDPDLTAIAALTTTSYGRSLLTPADAGAARALLGIGAKPAFSANKGGAAQSGIASGVETYLTFGVEAFDIGNYYNPANSRWTPPAGQYLVGAEVFFSDGVSAGFETDVAIKVNSATATGAFRNAPASPNSGASNIAILNLSGTDYVEVAVYAAGPGTKTVSGSAFFTRFFGHQI